MGSKTNKIQDDRIAFNDGEAGLAMRNPVSNESIKLITTPGIVGNLDCLQRKCEMSLIVIVLGHPVTTARAYLRHLSRNATDP